MASRTLDLANLERTVRYRPLIEHYSHLNGVDPELVAAIIYAESGGDPKAVSTQGAAGLMQLMPATAAELGVTDRHDAEQNISSGTRYLGTAHGPVRLDGTRPVGLQRRAGSGKGRAHAEPDTPLCATSSAGKTSAREIEFDFEELTMAVDLIRTISGAQGTRSESVKVRPESLIDTGAAERPAAARGERLEGKSFSSLVKEFVGDVNSLQFRSGHAIDLLVTGKLQMCTR